MTLRERLLSRPIVYRTFKRIVLPGDVLGRLSRDHFVAADGTRVLDLGCGFGDFAPYFAGRCDYLGIDHNEGYIETARALNAGSPARFITADVSDPIVAEHGPFELIMMSGVLHHLPSQAVRDLVGLVQPLVAPGGRFVAMEPVFDPDQRLSARLAIAADRGRFARDEEGYRALLATRFQSVESTIVTGMLRIPYTHVVLTAIA